MINCISSKSYKLAPKVDEPLLPFELVVAIPAVMEAANCLLMEMVWYLLSSSDPLNPHCWLRTKRSSGLHR